MAGDWIPMRIDLADDPDVIAIAGRLQLDEDLVVGKLLRFWGWVDQHTTDGNAPDVTYSWIDKRVGATVFCLALEMRGWIAKTDTGITVPAFDTYLGKNGKKRIQTAKRVAKHRAKNRSGNAASNAERGTCNASTEQNSTEQLETPIGVSPPLPPTGEETRGSLSG
jgi:hypothetical protein